jgi:hypothetical protein
MPEEFDPLAANAQAIQEFWADHQTPDQLGADAPQDARVTLPPERVRIVDTRADAEGDYATRSDTLKTIGKPRPSR